MGAIEILSLIYFFGLVIQLVIEIFTRRIVYDGYFIRIFLWFFFIPLEIIYAIKWLIKNTIKEIKEIKGEINDYKI